MGVRTGPSRILGLLCAGLLCSGCLAVPKQAFDPHGYANIHSIGIASIEYDRKISIRRYNPLYALMGSSGLVMQNLALEEKSARYMRNLRGFPEQCVRTAVHELRTALRSQGYVVRMLRMDYWEA